jgi:hypothetical protein
MKKKIVLSMVVSAMIFAGIAASAANTMQFPPYLVYYQVTVHAEKLAIVNCDRVVVITDKYGNPVVPAQQYVPGTSVYYFTDLGPITTTRVAQLQIAPVTAPSCPAAPVTDKKTGTFIPGIVYPFNLYLDVKVEKPVPTPVNGQ